MCSDGRELGYCVDELTLRSFQQDAASRFILLYFLFFPLAPPRDPCAILAMIGPQTLPEMV
jgi:hypothetical protein